MTLKFLKIEVMRCLPITTHEESHSGVHVVTAMVLIVML